jgi:translocator protein
MKNFFKLLVSLAIPLIIGFLGSFFTSSSVDSWYKTINKPFFNPPNWIFGPVWTFLFILIGLSFYFIWIKGFGKDKAKTIIIFSLQMFFNLLWSFLFFGLKSPLLGLFGIIILLFFILANIFVFYKISKIAGLLLLPYFFWVCFAFILNISIVILN